MEAFPWSSGFFLHSRALLVGGLIGHCKLSLVLVDGRKIKGDVHWHVLENRLQGIMREKWDWWDCSQSWHRRGGPNGLLFRKEIWILPHHCKSFLWICYTDIVMQWLFNILGSCIMSKCRKPSFRRMRGRSELIGWAMLSLTFKLEKK